MTEAIQFLNALGHALATMALYREGHPARERAVHGAYTALETLQEVRPRPRFTFLGDEVVVGTERVRELRAWEWGPRLAEGGIQRLEFGEKVELEDFSAFLADAFARVNEPSPSTAAARPERRTAIKYGPVGLRGERRKSTVLTATIRYSVGVEAETIRWLHEQVQQNRPLPLIEAELIVRSLAVAMHGERQMMLPLLRLRNFDEYTTTHSMNVSVLAMALGEYLRLGANEVRALGMAGLLHDIGKVNVPKEILTKVGKLTADEWAMMTRHPADGAKIIVSGHEEMELAAVVAYEHHIMLDGGGYPTFRFPRDCHYASKLVHVCDVYDALRTDRPYRDAWPAEDVLAYIDERAGKEFDPELAAALTAMMRRMDNRIVELVDENAPVETASAAPEAGETAAGAPGPHPERAPGADGSGTPTAPSTDPTRPHS